MEQPLLNRDDAKSIATLTLNRPHRRNALSSGLVNALNTEFSAIENDPEVRAVVLTGAGAGFCSGGDLAEGMGQNGSFVEAHRARGAFAALLKRMVDLRVPIVGAVNGHALGGGFGLAMSCDLVVLDANATLGTPEVGVGLFPMVILAVLQRRVPPRLLRELVFTGDRIDAKTALAHGLVNRVCDAGTALEAAMVLAERIAERSPTATAMGKQAMHITESMSLDESLAYLHQALTLNLMTEDAAEGIAAFLAKREPKFRGR